MRKVLGSVATLLGVLLLVVGITAKPVLYDGLATVKLNQRSQSTSEGTGMSALYAHEVNGSAVFDKLDERPPEEHPERHRHPGAGAGRPRSRTPTPSGRPRSSRRPRSTASGPT